MATIEIGREGTVTNSEHPNHRVRVVDDAASTGGFLIYEWWDGSDGPNGNYAFDSWVHTRADLEAFFREGGWNVEWKSV
ncbi:hypothetical protein [Usitatibacter rugosus]|uniref:hypothetical protein n=1 Tax=Usitatibacter rugosus TaxID=2732067 RepID=UPI00148784CA|nr:hypothetical protein [Usitatibacter rugosus]